MAGTGVGSFNDRLRDGARGGGPFDDPRIQGFVTGLYYDANGMPGSDRATRVAAPDRLVKVKLAGTLAGFTSVDRFGNTVRAEDVPYHD